MESSQEILLRDKIYFTYKIENNYLYVTFASSDSTNFLISKAIKETKQIGTERNADSHKDIISQYISEKLSDFKGRNIQAILLAADVNVGFNGPCFPDVLLNNDLNTAMGLPIKKVLVSGDEDVVKAARKQVEAASEHLPPALKGSVSILNKSELNLRKEITNFPNWVGEQLAKKPANVETNVDIAPPGATESPSKLTSPLSLWATQHGPEVKDVEGKKEEGSPVEKKAHS